MSEQIPEQTPEFHKTQYAAMKESFHVLQTKLDAELQAHADTKATIEGHRKAATDAASQADAVTKEVAAQFRTRIAEFEDKAQAMITANANDCNQKIEQIQKECNAQISFTKDACAAAIKAAQDKAAFQVQQYQLKHAAAAAILNEAPATTELRQKHIAEAQALAAQHQQELTKLDSLTK